MARRGATPLYDSAQPDYGSDLSAADHAAAEAAATAHADALRHMGVGLIALLLGVCSMSCVGSVVQTFRGMPGCLLGCWVAQGLHFAFVICSAACVACGALRGLPLPGARGFALMAVTGVLSGVGSAGFTSALLLTSQTDAYLFNSFPPLIILLARIVTGLPTFTGEQVGVAVNLLGAVLNVAGSKPGPSGASPLGGDSLALLSSATDAGTIATTKYFTGKLPTPCILSVVTLFSAATQAVMSVFLVPGGATISSDPARGLFGWASSERITDWLLLVGAFTVGQLLTLGSLTVLPSLVVSMGQSMQPIVATIIAVFITRMEPMPPPLSLFGVVLVVSGCLLLAYSARNHVVAPDAAVGDDDYSEPGQRPAEQLKCNPISIGSSMDAAH